MVAYGALGEGVGLAKAHWWVGQALGMLVGGPCPKVSSYRAQCGVFGLVYPLLVGAGSPSGWLINLGHLGTDAYLQVGR